MRIAELRNHPFLLLILKDGENDGYFSEELAHKIKQQLIDMSLRIASDNLSIIYADQIRKGCEIVLGITNLGLLDLCGNDSEQAKEIIKTQGIVYCFRAGWAKYAQLKKISPSYFESISLNSYALGINDTSDISALHASFMKAGYKSAKLLDVYKSIADSYCASTLLIDEDEEVLIFELQRFLNSAVALLMIGSDKKVFTSSIYQNLIDYLTTTESEVLVENLEASIVQLKAQLSLITKNYLQEIELLDFSEFKGIISQHVDVELFMPEILELPITISNELNDDFDGGYDFHSDDEDDIAYLRPDEY
ncbi:DUF6178 family protein [Colwellia echini]|uniref:Uncharacterized protein n=1 Tax=Colwellia echini TaxID=1982103 RepID=A0ABY3MVP9_9GAMM|nr:DUF6178 family protein [Colwellia echini]TYK65137.1 hypothetical protein CWS31_011740 [Colwellia echini]